MGGEAFSLGSVTYGSFTRPGVHEAMANSAGCEAHAHASSGSVLFRKVHGSWAFVEYFQALNTSACTIYHLKAGRDLLVCEGGNCFMGNCLQLVFLCDLSGQQNNRGSTVIEVGDTSGACPGESVSGSIDKAAWRSLKGEEAPVLTLWLTAGRSDPPGDSGDHCDEVKSRHQTRHYQLDFLYQPTSGNFLPAPWSRKPFEDFQTFNGRKR
jgi:hypothetical protein